MPRRIGGPEKALCTDVTIAAHAIGVRTTMLSLYTIESFSGFQLQDKHNASYFPKCYGAVVTFPTAKIQNFMKRLTPRGQKYRGMGISLHRRRGYRIENHRRP